MASLACLRKYFKWSLIIFPLWLLNGQEVERQETVAFLKAKDSLIKQIIQSEEINSFRLEASLFNGIKTDSARLSINIYLGRSFYRSGKYQRSIPYFEESIMLSRKRKDNKSLKNTYLLLGNAHLGLWQNEEALQAYYDALDVDITEDAKDYEVVIQPNVAIILRRMRQSEQALKVCKKALKLIPETRFFQKENHVNLITITCDALIDLGDWKGVEQLALHGHKMSQDLGYRKGLIDTQTKLGALKIQEKDYAAASKHLDMAASMLEVSGIESDPLQKNILYFTAVKQYAQGEFQAAIDGLSKIIKLYNVERPQNELRFIESFRLLASSYKELGDKENSIFWYEQYSKLNDDYQSKKAAVVSSIYEKETAILDEQIESLEIESLLSKRNKRFFFTLLCLVSLSFVMYLWNYKKKQRNTSSHVEVLTKKIEDLETRKESKIFKTRKKVKEVVIDSATTTQILNGLSRLEAQEYFLKTTCNLRSMARKIKTNATYLSYTLNHHRKQSFNEYLNDLRINYALKKINEDKKFRSFSIQSIARELGYKSDYSFSKHFKSKTGSNPSQYIKELEITD